MFKGKFVVLSVLAALLFCWQFMPVNVDTASSGIVDPCSSDVLFMQPGSRCLFICPQGDGQTLADGDNQIWFTIKDNTGAYIEGILASDFWLIGCTDLCLCSGSGSIDADSATGPLGMTTMSGSMDAGGCELVGVHGVVQGVIIGCPPICLTMNVVSPDLTCDGLVDLSDFSLFAQKYNKSCGDPLYDACADFDCDCDTDLVDFSLFAQHYNHTC